ncbi:MAG TPA: primosomal protein N' [Gammaproteobacteria bacterium]|nr:primosomal protein N' [Gammaproteobacteria bacterium]
MPTRPSVIRVAISVPLRRSFDYQIAPSALTVMPGVRVKVSFGRSETVGLVLALSDEKERSTAKLKAISAALETRSVIHTTDISLLQWASDYYAHPIGEVIFSALPSLLRQGEPAERRGVEHWRLTCRGARQEPDQLTRAPRQAALLRLLMDHPEGLSASTINERQDNWRPSMRKLAEKDWVVCEQRPALLLPAAGARDEAPTLNAEQQAALASLCTGLGHFGVSLLDGVTGSGKTEVYLGLIARVLARGEQALVLVPEIGLTPQLLDRFRRRFPVPIAVLHSGLSDRERLDAWLAARDGDAAIVIGTRSAVFTPLARPGVIILDEEHDASFKQQDGFRYSARDVAVKRAQLENIPVLLGSATPSLETLHNARLGRYSHLRLSERAGNARHPALAVLDVRKQPMNSGLSLALVNAMRRHLDADGQVLLFLNRRGYAPTLLCHDCGWVAKCRRCDAHMTLFAGQRRLRCHHCGSERPADPACPECRGSELRPVGAGTERLEEALQGLFPGIGMVRIDRDTTRRKGAMQALLDSVHDGSARILVGTQMLAKGHHFPEVTLVGMVDVDQGLFSADFRATERMAQLITQVAGRAGRAQRPGQVLIQTHHPDHPLLQLLLREGYAAFAHAALEERRQANLPPFSYLALLRAEAVDGELPLRFLRQARELAEAMQLRGVQLLGPIPAPMERRAGRVRAQLLLQANRRVDLHRLLDPWLQQLETDKLGRKVRWSVDVDPQEMF